MKIAVVILNWNGRALLEEFLPSVVKNSPEAQIYVADNASTDNSIPYVEQNFPLVKIIRNKENGGFARGYNNSLKHLKEDIFILLNSDVEVTENWLPPLIVEFSKDPDVAALQPKILDYRKRNYFEYAGAAGGFIDALGYPYCRGRIFQTLEEDTGQYDDTVEVLWATGACMAIRRKDYEEAGGFDEDFFAHQEEIDLCWRLFNNGRKIKVVGTSKVFHLGGGTLNSMHPRKTFYNFRNSLMSLVKNAPSGTLFLKVFLRLVLDGVAGLKFLIELKPLHTLSVIKAHFSFYGHLGDTLKKRKKLQQGRKYYNIISVLSSYYLKRIRKFRDL